MSKELKVTFTPVFKRDYKRLAKRYVSLESDLRQLVVELKSDPTQGVSLGSGAYKLRMAITSKRKGKSGGARLITYLILATPEDDEFDELYLLSIYDKSEQAAISDKKLRALIESVVPNK